MDKQYKPQEFEEKIYQEWEDKELFEAKPNKSKKPFSIILPPPNANADLHMGHAMYVYEDVMIRYHKLKGFETLWLPGADHAGFETQFVFEKQLQKQGKSRLDYDRKTLFKMIWDFVMENKGNMESQLKKMGFGLDWSKNKFTLDEDIVKIVYQTFKNLYDKGLVYRETRLVNYCVKDGTSFSDLEVIDKEVEGTLYFIKYPLVGGGYVTVATTRPETLLGDAAVMINPKDKRYKNLIGKKAVVPIVDREVLIIADEYVDMKFGTGAVKVTPAHDENDFEIGKKHNLPTIQVISFDGKIIGTGTQIDGMKIKQAREKVLELLKEKNLLEKEKKHKLVVKTCYKCGNFIEPLPLEQWFVEVKSLAEKVLPLIKKEKVRVIPRRQKERLLHWLENFHDWNISRQIVWGIRIPAWKCQLPKDIKIMGFHESVVPQVFKGKTKTYRIRDHKIKARDLVAFENSQTKEIFGFGKMINVEETTVGKINIQDKTHYITYNSYKELIKAFKKHHPEKEIDKKTKAYLYEYMFMDVRKEGKGCGRWMVTNGTKPQKCDNCGSNDLVQDEDTFDTWFSSAQWPYATLKTIGKEYFNYFYPTSVMETGYDILPWWVARMLMIGLFETGKEPFQSIFLHGLVRDKKGQKMSKSKGNVLNPMDMIDKYGADALRASLIFGSSEGNDIAFTEEKVIGMRNFTNKIWNMGRFIHMNKQNTKPTLRVRDRALDKPKMMMKQLEDEFASIKKSYFKNMDNFKFSKALDSVYEFLWHRFADYYIEELKEELKNGNIEAYRLLEKVYLYNLRMLHPFMPFVTEAIWKIFKGQRESVLETNYA